MTQKEVLSECYNMGLPESGQGETAKDTVLADFTNFSYCYPPPRGCPQLAVRRTCICNVSRRLKGN